MHKATLRRSAVFLPLLDNAINNVTNSQLTSHRRVVGSRSDRQDRGDVDSAWDAHAE